MEEQMYEVYIRVDDSGRITALDGGISIINVDKKTWIKIDEGQDPVRYGGCQVHYLEGGLYTRDMICRWKYVDGECVLRSDEEIEEERQSRPAPYDERADMEAALEMLGVR